MPSTESAVDDSFTTQADMPLVSVGIPVFNGEKWIEQTVQSILAQTLSDFEILILDNASNDSTAEICQRLAEYDQRIRFQRNSTNIGASENYNAVFRLARCKYFKWAAASDLIAPDFLEKCVSVLERRKDVVVCAPSTSLFVESLSDAKAYDSNLNLVQDVASERFKYYFQNVKLNNIMNGVIRTQCLAQTKLCELYLGSDIIMMSELAIMGKFVQLPERLFYRRMDRKTATVLCDPDELEKFYVPARKKRMKMQTFKSIFSTFAVIGRAKVSTKEKVRLYNFVLHQLFWSRWHLVADIKELIPHTEAK